MIIALGLIAMYKLELSSNNDILQAKPAPQYPFHFSLANEVEVGKERRNCVGRSWVRYLPVHPSFRQLFDSYIYPRILYRIVASPNFPLIITMMS